MQGGTAQSRAAPLVLFSTHPGDLVRSLDRRTPTPQKLRILNKINQGAEAIAGFLAHSTRSSTFRDPTRTPIKLGTTNKINK